MDPVCVVTIQKKDEGKVVEVKRKWPSWFYLSSHVEALYVGLLAKFPRPTTRKSEIDSRLREVEHELAEHVSRIDDRIRLQCQRYNVPSRESVHDHEPLLTGRGMLSENTPLALSPNMWFRCGSDWAKNIVRKEVGGLILTRHHGLGGQIHVGLRAAVPACNPACPVPQRLRLDGSHFQLPRGFELFLNIEKPAQGNLSSSCGLVCSIAIKKGTVLVHHGCCRIGGLLSIKDGDDNIKLVGVTSGHALLDTYLTTDPEETGDAEASSYQSERNPQQSFLRWLFGDANASHSSGQVQDASLDLGPPPGSPPARATDQERIDRADWVPVNSIYSVNWLAGGWESVKEFQFPFSVPHPGRWAPDADFALLELPGELLNNFRAPSQEIARVNTIIAEDDMTDEPVHVILGPEDVVQGRLLWHQHNLHIRGRPFPARKIQLERILPLGVSGCWVVQNGRLCGTICMIFEDEPFAYMMTAQKLVGDIKRTLGDQVEISIPRDDDIEIELEGTLSSWLWSAIVTSDPTSRERFIPGIELEMILTYHIIYKELGVLKSLSDEQRRELATYVYDTARRLFAILVIIDQTANILHFHRDRIGDADLPFKIQYHRGKVIWPEVLDKRRRGLRGHPERVMAFEKMASVFVEVFQRYQGLVLAPILSDSTDEEDAVYRVHDESPLPLMGLSSKPLEGGISTVHRAWIEPRQQNFKHTPRSKFVAVKILDSGPEGDDVLAREIKAHQTPRLHREPRLCVPYVFLERSGKYHIMAPWADGGNLMDVWRRHSEQRKPPNLAGLRWFFRECLGLAHGLSVIHGKKAEAPQSEQAPSSFIHGHHGDIKPENILCLDERLTTSEADHGLLTIGDFGTSAMSGETARRSMAGELRARSSPYRPPEFDDDPRASSRSDMWSFGCILLEFTSWLLLGYAGVEAFAKARLAFNAGEHHHHQAAEDTFFCIDGPEARFSPACKEWIEHLRKECPVISSQMDVVRDLLSYIEGNLLVVDPDQRDTAVATRNLLVRLYGRTPDLFERMTLEFRRDDRDGAVQDVDLVRASNPLDAST